METPSKKVNLFPKQINLELCHFIATFMIIKGHNLEIFLKHFLSNEASQMV